MVFESGEKGDIACAYGKDKYKEEYSYAKTYA